MVNDMIVHHSFFSNQDCVSRKLRLRILFQLGFEAGGVFAGFLLHTERLHETILFDDELHLFGMNGDGGRRSDFLLIFRISKADAAFVKVVVELDGAVRKSLQQLLGYLG